MFKILQVVITEVLETPATSLPGLQTHWANLANSHQANISVNLFQNLSI